MQCLVSFLVCKFCNAVPSVGVLSSLQFCNAVLSVLSSLQVFLMQCLVSFLVCKFCNAVLSVLSSLQVL